MLLAWGVYGRMTTVNRENKIKVSGYVSNRERRVWRGAAVLRVRRATTDVRASAWLRVGVGVRQPSRSTKGTRGSGLRCGEAAM